VKVKAGTWVQVRATVLSPGERAPAVPPDTARVPLEMRVKGFLLEETEMGKEACVSTVTGRRARGTLEAVEPWHTHGFGEAIPELLTIGPELRKFLGGDPS
jgi:hypothetical protein